MSSSTSLPIPFGVRLRSAMDQFGPLCVGIDPHPGLLKAWGLPDTAAGLNTFAMTVVDAVGGHVAALKPQLALFERHGSAGIKVLEDVLAASAAVGTLTIADAKRGDIGSTMEGYASAFLRSGSSLAADALTVSPYLGFGSLTPAIELAQETGRGLFVLCLTSNPQGASVQHARNAQGNAVAKQIALDAAEVNTQAASAGQLGSIGLVVGATVGTAVADLDIDLAAVNGPFLAPGVGAQGAGPAELNQVFGRARSAVLASSSRAVLQAGPDILALRQAALRAAGDVTRALK